MSLEFGLAVVGSVALVSCAIWLGWKAFRWGTREWDKHDSRKR